MDRLFRFFICTFFLSTAVSGYSKVHKISSRFNAVLQEKIHESVLNNGGYGGVVFRVGAPKKLLWEGAAGTLDATDQHAMNVRSTFEIASVTKTFTAAVILQMVEEKRFKLNTKLEKLLPASTIDDLLVVNRNDYTAQISVEQLLNHTSGLAHFWDDPPFVKKGYNRFFSKFEKDEDRLWSPRELLAFVPQLRPVALPGKNFHYSDTNYVLLGMIIEAVEKQPLHDVFRKRIFNRLGMKDTYLSFKEKPRSPYKESHRFFDDDDLHGKKHWSADWASGGLVSSTRDLEKFLFALASGKMFRSKKTSKLMRSWVHTDDGLYYGLGVYGIKLERKKGVLWGHDGWGGAFMYYWPEKNIAFTGTVNQTGSEEEDNETEWWNLVEAAIKALT